VGWKERSIFDRRGNAGFVGVDTELWGDDSLTSEKDRGENREGGR